MNLTASKLAQAMGIGDDAAALWIAHVNNAIAQCNCRTPEHAAMWIAQIGHESAGMSRLVESLNYSADGLVKTWPSRFTPESAARVGRTASKPADQQEIAEIVYGGRLGNIHPGDSWRFRGRGLIQITGRANYRECGQSIGADLEQEPSLLEMRSTAALSTAWYWRKHKLTGYSGDVLRVTRLINGGTNGLKDRQARYDKALSVLAG